MTNRGNAVIKDDTLFYIIVSLTSIFHSINIILAVIEPFPPGRI